MGFAGKLPNDTAGNALGFQLGRASTMAEFVALAMKFAGVFDLTHKALPRTA